MRSRIEVHIPDIVFQLHVNVGVRMPAAERPGLVTGLVLFIPFTVFVLAGETARGALSGAEIGLIVLLGIVLHVPVAAPFAVRFQRRSRAGV